MNKSKLKVLSILLILSFVLCLFTSCNDAAAEGENANLSDIIKTYKSNGIIAWWEVLAVYNAGENPVNYRGFKEICQSLSGNEYNLIAPYVIIANIAIINGADERDFDKYEKNKAELIEFLKNPSEQHLMYDYIYAYHALKSSGISFDQTPVLNYFLKEQKSDGGFALIGDRGDADMTALVIPVLQLLLYHADDSIDNFMYRDESPLTNAVKFLESQIGENGAFSYSGEDNSASTACAITAFAGYYKDDGSSENSPEIIKKAYDGLANFRVKRKAAYAYLINEKADIISTAQVAIALGDLKNKTSVWEKLYTDSIKY